MSVRGCIRCGITSVVLIAAGLPAMLWGQAVQPVIEEYKGNAEGKFSVVNDTLEPMTVVLDARSFSITPEGHGVYRALDPKIHLELSTMSFRLQPQQTYWVFYKATADEAPAWFTIYSTFSSPRHGDQINVQLQLPHTVYLYQKKPLERSDIVISEVTYSASSHKISCELKNVGQSLGRVQQVRTTGARGASALASGFPMLPGMTRKLEVEWKAADPPTTINVIFEHFTLKPQIVDEIAPKSASVASRDQLTVAR